MNLLIARYALIALAILNLASSVAVIIYDRIATLKAQEELPDDWYTKSRMGGSWAKYWFAACCVVYVLSSLFSLLGLLAAYKERAELSMLYSLLMSLVAVYGAWDIYVRGSVVAFLVPLVAAITALLYGTLNYRDLVEQVEGQYLKVNYTKRPTEDEPVKDEPETEKFQPE